MPRWTGEEGKYRRSPDLENSALNHIFSGQRRSLLVLSQSKLRAPTTAMINRATCYNSHTAQSRESEENAEKEFTLKLKDESKVPVGFSEKEAKI